MGFDGDIGGCEVCSSSSSSDESGAGKSDVRISLILRYFNMGLCLGIDEGIERSSLSWAEVADLSSTDVGTGFGFGGGDQSTAVCSGP